MSLGFSNVELIVDTDENSLEEGGDESVFGKGSEEECPGSSRGPPLAAPRGCWGNLSQASVIQKQVRSLGSHKSGLQTEEGTRESSARPQSCFP